MDPSERENSQSYSNYTPSYNQPPKRSSKLPDMNRAAVVLGVLFVVALLGAAAMAWLWQQESARVASLKQRNSSLEKTVSDLKSPNAPADSTKTGKKSGFDLMQVLMQTVTTYEQAQTNLANKSLKVRVTKWTDQYAVAEVSTGTSASDKLFLKNVSGTWVVIGDGSSDRANLQAVYGLPKDF